MLQLRAPVVAATEMVAEEAGDVVLSRHLKPATAWPYVVAQLIVL
jgi:hypothetical protein